MTNRLSASRAATLCTLAVITVALTLTPVGEKRNSWAWCIVCGDVGGADAVLNILLFVPVAIALAWSGFSRMRAITACATFSLCIELCQLFVSGRDPTLGDVVFNTVGGAVGFGIVALRRWTALAPEVYAARVSVLVACVVATVMAITGFSFQPLFPAAEYTSEWAAQSEYLAWYQARVVDARLGTLELTPSQVGSSELPRKVLPFQAVRDLILSGAPFTIDAVAGPATRSLAPLLAVYFQPSRQPELFLVGVDREDVVLRYRSRAVALRLQQPLLRATGALHGVREGQPMSLAVSRSGNAFDLRGPFGAPRRLAFTFADGWSLLFQERQIAPGLKTALGFMWMSALMIPLGFWLRRRVESLVAIALAVSSMLVVEKLLALAPLPMYGWIAACLGLIVGAMIANTKRSGVPADAS